VVVALVSVGAAVVAQFFRCQDRFGVRADSDGRLDRDWFDPPSALDFRLRHTAFPVCTADSLLGSYWSLCLVGYVPRPQLRGLVWDFRFCRVAEGLGLSNHVFGLRIFGGRSFTPTCWT
jgi:hypothetical protein